jgi:chaperone BCS1
MFHRPPETGKSNFALPLAGHFNLDVHVLDIPTLNNRTMKNRYAETPQHCIVLLEDFDAVGVKQDTGSNSVAGKSISREMPAAGAV